MTSKNLDTAVHVFVRIKSDQESAIVDIQRAVISKHSGEPTILVNLLEIPNPMDGWKTQPGRFGIW